jgi:polyribonucleotide nucleotidyltransferase
VKVERQFGAATLTIETGHLAKQASGAVVVRLGDTMVLVTAVGTEDQRVGIDFVPLTVDYQERFYAVGRIPGNFFRREVGRPSEKETLTSRFIDRPCRPLFPKTWNYETQVIATALSVDENYDPDILAMIGASAALELSDIPFNGPIAGTKVVRVDGELVVNPTQAQIEASDMNIIVAGSRDAVVMVEGGAQEVSEEELLNAIFLAHREIQPILDMQEELKAALGKPKRQPPEVVRDEALLEKVKTKYRDVAREALTIPAKLERHKKFAGVCASGLAEMLTDHPESTSEIKEAFHELERDILRGMVLKERKRLDGRSFNEVRPITCEVGVLPRAHGSSIFTRGETQAMGIATLGTTYDDQRLDAVIGDSSKSFMLHYNFPPFCVGEAKMLRAPGRREVGHGALAERTLKAVMPSMEEFPYTVRVVSEVLESNGSSSMATVCAGTLALMDAGVPIKAPVAGVAMGLVVEGSEVAVLTDILGDEDHLGDMDFKITGSRQGVTAVQMDIKIKGVTREIMSSALAQAKEGRLFIIDKMEQTLTAPRVEISPYAPQMTTIEINPEKIKDIIGPGGKHIKAIQSETETRIDIDDSGKIAIYGPNTEATEAAIRAIKRFTQEPEIDQVYLGRVVKIMDFGAFVEILPGTDGLVHISQLSHERVQRVSDVVREGDEILVKVLGIDKQGKIRLSRKAVLDEEGKDSSSS